MHTFRGLFIAALLATGALAGPAAWAASDCESKAVSKDGKPLAGAAKASFIKKCQAESKSNHGCAEKAIDKNGKPLAGAAKNSFMKKCEAQAGQ